VIVTEDGSELAEELWEAADLKVSSQLIYPEALAALAAASRADRIDARGLRRAVTDLEAAVASIRRIGVDELLARDAGRLAQEHALRGYDTVHLATALTVEDPTLIVVTWDSELARAALEAGRAVAPTLTN
jgi:predicted nucleic acid-binding protein